MSQKFRYDINGLRAYAVATVVLFHFGILGFSAGFIGVDIFFVISGFLMTSIVVKGIENKNFSFLKFYLSRAIRILPALFVVCVVLLVISWHTLLPNDLMQLSKHIISSINFFSNITYFTESGYFDTSSHNKALLHTWSLSVEWQFYLIFPLIVAILYKFSSSKKFILSMFLLGTIASFILAIFIANKSPSAGFFLLPTRAWEMLAGGLVYFYSLSAKNNIYGKPLEAFGFILILISLVIFNQNTLWPSFNALIPVLGTALILIANHQDSVFTKHPIFQWLGNTSYSIYLWHWPIVFYLNYYEKLDNYLLITFGIILSILTGYLSYKYIESPTRNYLSKKQLKSNYIIWFLSVGALSLISFLIYKNEGFDNRFNNKINSVLDAAKDINPKRDECLVLPGQPLKSCIYGQGATSLLVIGDSHASAMMNGIQHALPNNTSLVSWNISGCTVAEGLKKITDPAFKCGELVTETIQTIKTYPKDIPILIINRANALFAGEPENEDISKPIRYITKLHSQYNNAYYKEMEDAYVDTLCKLSETHKVYVTRPTPEAPVSVPQRMAKDILQNPDSASFTISNNEYQVRNKSAWEAQDRAKQKCGIEILDISKAFCDEKKCSFSKDGLPLFVDDDHMSWKGSLILSPYFQKIFK